MFEPYPLRFTPLFRDYVWGGTRLQSELGKPTGPGIWAESWEVVDHVNGQSVVSSGPAAGQALCQLVNLWQERLVGKDVWARIQSEATPAQLRGRFPLLFKFLDAAQNLSVQVHPDDTAGARQTPPDLGKTEAWYILAAAPGSQIYAGLKPGVTREDFIAACRQNQAVSLLHSFPAAAGQSVFISAGTIHAIGAGLLVAEIQQASDTTYRIDDWGRMGNDGKPRPLHLQQALEVSDFVSGPVEPIIAPAESGNSTLVRCPYFELNRISAREPFELGGDGRFHLLAVIGGAAEISGSPGKLDKGATVLLPAALGPTRIEPSAQVELLEIHVP
jgi:mannose-6-phosphate isomerase